MKNRLTGFSEIVGFFVGHENWCHFRNQRYRKPQNSYARIITLESVEIPIKIHEHGKIHQKSKNNFITATDQSWPSLID